MAFHFSSHFRSPASSDSRLVLALGTMHSLCTLNVIPSVLLRSSSPVTHLTIVDASDFVYLANTLYSSSLALRHFSLFESRNSSCFKISSACLTPSASAALIISANSPFIPDTAVLIFHDQFCHWSSPPDDVSMSTKPSCSHAVAETVSRSQQLMVEVHLVAAGPAASAFDAGVIASNMCCCCCCSCCCACA